MAVYNWASIIDAASITDLYAEQLASINQSLAEGADILFYGCDFASTESGIETLQVLNATTNPIAFAEYVTAYTQ